MREVSKGRVHLECVCCLSTPTGLLGHRSGPFPNSVDTSSLPSTNSKCTLNFIQGMVS